MGMGMGMGGAAAAMGRGMAMGGMAPVHPFLQAQRGALLPPPKATLYVEGVPMDATEREVYHLFRPFPGLTSLRLRSAGSSARMVGATACLLAWMDARPEHLPAPAPLPACLWLMPALTLAAIGRCVRVCVCVWVSCALLSFRSRTRHKWRWLRSTDTSSTRRTARPVPD